MYSSCESLFMIAFSRVPENSFWHLTAYILHCVHSLLKIGTLHGQISTRVVTPRYSLSDVLAGHLLRPCLYLLPVYVTRVPQKNIRLCILWESIVVYGTRRFVLVPFYIISLQEERRSHKIQNAFDSRKVLHIIKWNTSSV